MLRAAQKTIGVLFWECQALRKSQWHWTPLVGKIVKCGISDVRLFTSAALSVFSPLWLSSSISPWFHLEYNSPYMGDHLQYITMLEEVLHLAPRPFVWNVYIIAKTTAFRLCTSVTTGEAGSVFRVELLSRVTNETPKCTLNGTGAGVSTLLWYARTHAHTHTDTKCKIWTLSRPAARL